MNSTLEKSIIKISKKYNKNLYEIKIVIDEMLKDEIKKIEENELTNPIKILVDIISIQKNKEEKVNIWNDSIFKNISTLESNNVGNVGEILIQQICEYVNIDSNINGCKNKQIGGSKIITMNILEIYQLKKKKELLNQKLNEYNKLLFL